MKTYKEIIEGKELVVTDSLIVAKFFEIEHKALLRTIRNIEKRLDKRFINNSHGAVQHRENSDIGSLVSQSLKSEDGAVQHRPLFVKSSYKANETHTIII